MRKTDVRILCVHVVHVVVHVCVLDSVNVCAHLQPKKNHTFLYLRCYCCCCSRRCRSIVHFNFNFNSKCWHSVLITGIVCSDSICSSINFDRFAMKMKRNMVKTKSFKFQYMCVPVFFCKQKLMHKKMKRSQIKREKKKITASVPIYGVLTSSALIISSKSNTLLRNIHYQLQFYIKSKHFHSNVHFAKHTAQKRNSHFTYALSCKMLVENNNKEITHNKVETQDSYRRSRR